MTVFVFYSKQKVWKSNIPHLFAELTNFHPYQRWLKRKNISSKLSIFKFPIYEISIPQYIHKNTCDKYLMNHTVFKEN